MTLGIGLRWTVHGADIDPRLLALLAAIDERGSLKQASGQIRMSYRHAWELLGRLETAVGRRLVQLERGRGATLTPAGRQMLGTTRAIEARLQGELARATLAFERSLAQPLGSAEPGLRVCASHDFALNRLVELLPRHGGARLELRVQGSLDALASLARRRCDIAGFHVPALPGRQPLIEPFRPWLKHRRLRLAYFADRSQGLIVAKRNPLAIASLADLAERQARFVNRQPGSGTRIFFDALLAANRIRPAQINGYRHEEFTHAAVAAMIASGAADAAFGVEAAAALQGLSFVPLATERYFLAMGEDVAARPAARGLLAALGSRWFRNAVRELPGYAMPAQAVLVPVQEAFAGASQ